MAKTAWLTAAASVALAAGLAATVPSTQGAGIAAMISWAGVAVLSIGLLYGYRGSVTAVAVAFVLRVAVVSTLATDPLIPLWAYAMTLVLIVELASASFRFRARASETWWVLGRALLVSLLVAVGVETVDLVVSRTEASGVMVRAAGVAAVVVAAGWVARTWRHSGLSG
ncbi:MAG: hypothetical protein WB245_04645 [Acidimicrobiia bacterium]